MRIINNLTYVIASQFANWRGNPLFLQVGFYLGINSTSLRRKTKIPKKGGAGIDNYLFTIHYSLFTIHYHYPTGSITCILYTSPSCAG